MAPNSTTELQGKNAEPKAKSTRIDKTSKEHFESNASLSNSQQGYDTGSRQAQPANLEGKTDNYPQSRKHFFSQHFRIFASSQTPFLEEFPGKSKFWSLVSQHDINNLEKYPSIFDMFTNSIDGTDFFRKILAFSTQLFGSFSNSLSSKEKEIFDIDSPREVIERLTRGQSSNPLWFKYRQMTITGSKAHMLNNAAKKGVLSSYARKMLMGSQDPKELNVPPVIYGRNNEAVARNDFIARKTMIGGLEYLPGFTFQERGMYIDRNYPFIAASVDGLYSYFDTNVDHPHHDNNDTPKSQSCFPTESQHSLDSGFSINDENIKFSLMDNCFENNHGFDSPGKRVTRLLEIKAPYVLRHIGLKKGIHKLTYLEPVIAEKAKNRAATKKAAAYPLQNQSLIQRRRKKSFFKKKSC